MNRKGDWIQVFLVLFFFLLLVVTFALLFAEKGTLETSRPEMAQDLADQRAHALLANTLRRPVEGLDISGDGRPDPATVADLISLNQRRENDDAVASAINGSLGAIEYYQLFIWYTGEIPTGFWDKLVDDISGDFQQVRNARILAGPYAAQDRFENLGSTEGRLPGTDSDITMRLVVVDPATRLNGKPARQELERREEVWR